MKYSTEYWSLSHGSGPSAGIAYDRSRLPLSISVTVTGRYHAAVPKPSARKSPRQLRKLRRARSSHRSSPKTR